MTTSPAAAGSMEELTVDLVDASVSSDVDSFDRFYRREWAAAVRYGWALTGSRTAAEDLAQDAFIAAQRSWKRIGGFERPDAWVRRAMTNRSTNRLRRLGRETRARMRMRSGIELTVELPEASDHVWAAVRRLSPRQMQVVALTYLDDLSVDEVAEILECGSETVRTHLRRARAHLAEELADTDTEEYR